MSNSSESQKALAEALSDHYESGYEGERLTGGSGRLELARTREIIERFLPSPPAVVVDVGGGPGVYACWLARKGYEVHLIDALPLHVELARKASASQPAHPVASLNTGDARRLERTDSSADAVLLLGPLYHLIERGERIQALAEARRVVREGGAVIAAVISRFASTLDGLCQGFLDDPEFVKIVERDLKDGQHRNPTNHPAYFTTAYFHHPGEIASEFEDAGLSYENSLSVEGPAWLLQNFDEQWQNPARRERLLAAIRRVEDEPSIIGASAHILAIGRKRS